MRTFKSLQVFIVVLLLSITACKKDIDNSIYEVNRESLYPSASSKTKLKTQEQYISILYTNLFQQALSGNQLFQLGQCMESIGDKELAREVIISNFMNKPQVQIPADEEMRENPDEFIRASYERFFVRYPTEAEVTWFRNFLSAHPQLSAEMVYFAFALSNEYLYY